MIPNKNKKKKSLEDTVEEMRNLSYGYIEKYSPSKQQLKIFLLVGVTGFHGALARWRRFFLKDANSLTPGFYRLINEVPTLLMIGIVLLAILKPAIKN